MHSLFQETDNITKIQPSTTFKGISLIEWPEHYDHKDIEKDYKSECPKGTRKIKKKNRAKIGVNLVGKARK